MPPLNFDLDVNTSGQVELHQRVHGLGCWINDIQQTLVRADFKLVTRFLVNVGTTQNSEFLDLVRQRDRATYRAHLSVWLC